MNSILNEICKDFSIEKNFIKHKDFGKFAKINDSENQIKESFKNIIYSQYYCLEKTKHTTQLTDIAFLNQLSSIQLNNKYLDGGWKVVEIVNQDIIKVAKNNICLTVDLKKGTLLNEIPKINQSIEILFSCHFPNVSPGFYLYKSKKGDTGFTGNLCRIYINLKKKEAAIFAEKLMTCLNEEGIAFQFKILQTLPSSKRIDNSVLYFNKSDKKSVLKVVTKLYDNRYFNPINSNFHLILFPGIGYAEEPLNNKDKNESYGTHRSKIIAESLHEQMFLEKKKTISPERIKEKFLEYGINSEKVYEEIEIII
jgi:hypothetical protein